VITSLLKGQHYILEISMPIAKNNSATLIDVAREAKVSLKTASRVLNKNPYVNAKTEAEVLAVMGRLGYRPNELARGLKARKSAAIGMIVKNFSNPFTASVIKAVQKTARAKGYIVILASSHGDSEIERSEIESLICRQIAGLVIAPIGSPKSNFTNIIPSGLEVVTFDQPIRNSNFDSVMIDNRHSAKRAVQHLLNHNYRDVVAIGTRPYLYTSSQRIAGYRSAMKNAGLNPIVCMVEHEDQLTSEWLSRTVFVRPKIDAIISMNWVCTMLTLRGMRQIGRALYGSVPFLSFDDFELADMLTPSLSAVRQPVAELGHQAAMLLFERIDGIAQNGKRSIILPTELVLRESCGCDSQVS
jgi:LacI family transcriptional regulator